MRYGGKVGVATDRLNDYLCLIYTPEASVGSEVNVTRWVPAGLAEARPRRRGGESFYTPGEVVEAEAGWAVRPLVDWGTRETTVRESRHRPGWEDRALDALLNIAAAKDEPARLVRMVRRFVEDYGRLPFNSQGGLESPRRSAGQIAAEVPISHYAELATAVDELIKAERNLREWGGSHAVQWTALAWVDPVLAERGTESRGRLRLGILESLVSLGLGRLTAAADVVIEAGYGPPEGAVLYFAGAEPLFAIVRGLVSELGPDGMLARCAAGGHLYRRTGRRPKRGQRNYCKEHGAHAGYRDSVRRVKHAGAVRPRVPRAK